MPESETYKVFANFFISSSEAHYYSVVFVHFSILKLTVVPDKAEESPYTFSSFKDGKQIGRPDNETFL